MQRGTIVDHLAKYAQEGNPLREDEGLLNVIDVPEGLQAAALEAFAQLGAEFLKPVFDELNGAVSYDDLKILRVHYWSRLNH